MVMILICPQVYDVYKHVIVHMIAWGRRGDGTISQPGPSIIHSKYSGYVHLSMLSTTPQRQSPNRNIAQGAFIRQQLIKETRLNSTGRIFLLLLLPFSGTT